MTHARVSSLVAAAASASVILALTGGCDSDTPEPAAQAGNTTPSTNTAPIREAAVPDELTGHWMARLSQADLRHDLRAAGYGKRADDYIAAENAEVGYLYVLTLDEDTFNVAYFQEGQIWHVGWQGAATDVNGTLTLTDDFSSIVDSYTWTVEGDQLTLDFAATTGGLLDTLPSEAYSRAHFSRPLTAVACGPADLQPPPDGTDWYAAADDIERQLTSCD